MKGSRCQLLVTFLLFLNGLGAQVTEKIPLGAIFEQGTEEVQSAFKFAMLNHNINITTRRFELQAFVDIINTADAFKLSKLICNQFSRGVYSMLGAVSPDSFDTLHSYSNTFQMPFVTPWFPEKVTTPSSGFLDFAISMRPDYHQAIIDTIVFYGWKNIIYLYDSHDGLLRLQQIYQSLQPGSESFKVETVQRIANESDAIAYLRRLEQMDRWSTKYIVLDCPAQMAKEIVVSHVRDVLLGRRNYHYLLSGLIMDDQWETQVVEYGAINITGFRIVDNSRRFVKDFLEGWSRLEPSTSKGAGKYSISAQAALMYDAVYVLIDAFTKLLKKKPDQFRIVGSKKVVGHMMSSGGGAGGINNTGSSAECNLTKSLIDAWEHGDKISRYLRKVEIEGLTGEIRFNEEGRRINYTLNVVEMSVNSAMVKVAEWSDESKFMSIAAKYVRLHSGKELPQNRTYIVTTILEEPYVMRRTTPEGAAPLVGNNRFEGYCKDLADLIAERTGITYEMRVVADGNYGTENAVDGSWDGMVGELVRKNADLAIAPMTITSARERVIDFSKPYMSLGISIMIKKPIKQKPGIFSFLSPLSTEIWISVICSYVGVSIVLFIVSRFSPYEWRLIQMNGEPLEHLPVACTGAGSSANAGSAPDCGAGNMRSQQPSVNEFSIMNSLWFALGAFMQQGCDISPRSISGRIVGSVWWFFTLILISSYTANLAAFLTFERMVTNINSPEDLAAQSEVQYGTIRHGSTREFFRRSSLPTYSRMWEYMSAHPGVFVANYTDGIQRVRNAKGKYALLVESPKNDYTNERQPCDTMKVGDNLDMKGFGIGTPLHSPLRDGINLAVLSLIEDGNMTRLKNKWWFERSECPASDKQDARNELSLSNVAGIFFILIVGLFVAMLVALVEYCMTRRKKSAAATSANGGSGCAGGGSGSGAGGGGGSQHMPSMSTASLKAKSELSIQAANRDGYDNGRAVVGFDKQMYPTHQYYAANGPMMHHNQDTIQRRSRPHPTQPNVM